MTFENETIIYGISTKFTGKKALKSDNKETLNDIESLSGDNQTLYSDNETMDGDRQTLNNEQ